MNLEIIRTKCPEDIEQISQECLEKEIYHPTFYAEKLFRYDRWRIVAICYIVDVGWSMIIKYDWDEEIIATVYVRPECRRQGIGTLLFDSMKEFYGKIPGVKKGTPEGSLFFEDYFSREKQVA